MPNTDITKTKWFKELKRVGPFQPYDILPSDPSRKNGKVSKEMKAFTRVPGVYIIRDGKGKVRYVGATGYSLYTTVTRRFQEWNDRKFERITYGNAKGFTAEVIPIKNDPKRKKIFAVELHYIKKLKPSDNIEGLFDPKENETENEYYRRIAKEEKAAFDGYINSYEAKAKDPIRGTSGQNAFFGIFDFLKESIPF